MRCIKPPLEVEIVIFNASASGEYSDVTVGKSCNLSLTANPHGVEKN
jgi:hypothetical protein